MTSTSPLPPPIPQNPTVSAINEALGGAAGAIGALANPNVSVQSCLIELAALLPHITTLFSQDGAAEQRILEMLAKPLDELTTAVSDLLLPDSDALGDGTLSSLITESGKQLAQSVLNPFESIMRAQAGVFDDSLEQIKRILFTGDDKKNGFLKDYFDKTEIALRSLFLNPDTGEANLAGVFVYAFEHGLPAIDAELYYLKLMRVSAYGLSEESSKLPSIIDFQLPNTSIIKKLCEAERDLIRVSDGLHFESTFDRGAFSSATKHVCSAQADIFTGRIDVELLKKHAKNFLGVGNYKDRDLANLRFLPDVTFKLGLQTLKTLGELFKAQERSVTELHFNMTTASDAIARLADVQIGGILSLLVDVLRRQVSSIRREMESHGAGYDTQTALNTSQGEATIKLRQQQEAIRNHAQLTADEKNDLIFRLEQESNFGTEKIDPYKLPPHGIRIDVTSYLSSQVSAFVVLSSLCALMQRAPAVYNAIEQMLRFESNIMRTIQGLVSRFDPSTCGNPQSGEKVIFALQNYLNAADARLREEVLTNEALNTTGRDLLACIRERETFLLCMRSRLSLGLEGLTAGIEAIANGRAILVNLRALAARFPEQAAEMRRLNLKRVFGLEKESYSVTEAFLKAAQCLLANCDNPTIQEIMPGMVQEVAKKYENRKTDFFDMASLDNIPKIAARARSNRRIQQIMRLLAAIKGILNLDTNQLCTARDADQARESNVRRSSAARSMFGTVVRDPVIPTQSGATSPELESPTIDKPRIFVRDKTALSQNSDISLQA